MPFLTTDAPTDDLVCRSFSIPDNLLHIFMGALFTLANPINWEQDGDQTPDEMAETFRLIVENYTRCRVIGTIVAYLTETPPDGVLELNGQQFDGVDYPLLAVEWAGTDLDNGDGTFNTPNTRGHVLCHISATSPDAVPYYLMGYAGAKTHTLTTAEMPNHKHTYDKAVAAASTVLGALTGVEIGAYATTDTSLTGGGGAHNNVQPSFGVNYGVIAR